MVAAAVVGTLGATALAGPGLPEFEGPELLVPMLWMKFVDQPRAEKRTTMLSPYVAKQPDGGAVFVARTWVYELEEKTLSRSAAVHALRKLYGVPKSSEDESRLRSRVVRLMADNERAERVVCTAGAQRLEFPPTKGQGISELSMPVQLTPDAGSLRINCERKAHSAHEVAEFDIAAIPEEGLSIASDVDDTIKDSNVLNKSELARNTLYREYKPVAGMSEAYAAVAGPRVFFHYVSNSPWQLIEPLADFLASEKFPRGLLHLRPMRLSRPVELERFLTEGQDSKRERITALMNLFPKHAWVFIGDSGEHDPEIYAQLFEAFPGRVRRILIRQVPGADNSDARWTKVFSRVPRAQWTLFSQRDARALLTEAAGPVR